jgi:hypothetical protein
MVPNGHGAPEQQPRYDNVDWRTRELLVRLDEKTTAIDAALKDLKGAMVTQAEFKPIRMVVYGLIAILTTGVIGALLSSVIKQG